MADAVNNGYKERMRRTVLLALTVASLHLALSENPCLLPREGNTRSIISALKSTAAMLKRSFTGGLFDNESACPPGSDWYDFGETQEDKEQTADRSLGAGDAIHLVLKIKRVKNAIKKFCRQRNPNETQQIAPRKSSMPSFNFLDLGKVIRGRLTVRRRMPKPMKRFVGWTVGTVAMAFMLR